jgi:hypothetical protein
MESLVLHPSEVVSPLAPPSSLRRKFFRFMHEGVPNGNDMVPSDSEGTTKQYRDIYELY